VHERYRQTTDDRRQTDGRRHIANMNMSSRSLKFGKIWKSKFPNVSADIVQVDGIAD